MLLNLFIAKVNYLSINSEIVMLYESIVGDVLTYN